MTAPHPPSGTVAFLFTDIEGSTRRWEAHGPAMGIAVARHDALLRGAIEGHGGVVFKTVGDAFCAAFGTVPPAMAAAQAAQRALEGEDWAATGPIRARMAVHVGAAEERAGDYAGPAVDRAGRLLSAGHGGQVLVSRAAEQLVGEAPPGGAALRDLGEHRLKDLGRPERIFQLVAPDLPADFPPLSTLDGRPNNLPSQLTPLVGREREVASVAAYLERPGARLLTLTGPGGTGKTRLSLQVAADVIDDFPHGVWFVELEAATDEAAVVAAIAMALGVREAAGQALRETLLEFLAPKRLLLVLDNFEQVAHAAPVVAVLLTRAPGVQALVSSRVRLGLSGEQILRVPPLGLPPGGHRQQTPEELSQYDAVRLFVERAQAAKSTFELTADNAATVAQICRDLDGLPLAIELAAARVKLLPPPALLARLEDKLGLLAGGGRDRSQRQQTLRGAIAWSHDLLPPAERVLFARLSVFAGGCDLAAGEAVANPGGGLDLFAALSALVDHSLVRQEETAEGDARFALLATIRAFAAEQLEAAGGGDAELTRMLHAEHFLAFAEQAEPELTGPDQALWLERLEREHDNVRAALEWYRHASETEQGARLAAALRRFWYVRGYPGEGRRWLNLFLADEASIPCAVRGKALDTAGWLAMVQGDYVAATRLTEAALDCYDAVDDRAGTARARTQLGLLAADRGDRDTAARHYEAALALYRAAGDGRGIAIASGNLGRFAFQGGNITDAIAFYDEALGRSRTAGDEQTIIVALVNLAEAREFQGDLERASRLFREALERSRRLGDQLDAAFALIGLGRLSLRRGDVDPAVELLDEGLSTFHELGDVVGVADALEALARARVAAGDPVTAARWLGAAAEIRETFDVPLDDVHRPNLDRFIATLRADLGAAGWAEAFAAGRALSTEQLVSESIDFAKARRQ